MNEFFILMRGELMICLIIFLLLFIKLGGSMNNGALLKLMYVLLTANVALLFFGESKGQLFAGLFVTSPMLVFQKSILALGTLLIALMNHQWLKRSAHMPEFFMLMLSALLGMYFMLSSGNMLIFYLSLELATIPVAALANFDLDKKISSEAAMKMILSSAFASGILLFGISLLYGATGTLEFQAMASQLKQAGSLGILGYVLFLSAFTFKLSVVPFHLWTADVYEGSPVAVTAFLSVISKGAVAFVLMRMLYFVFAPMGNISYHLLTILLLATLLTGNLFALRQNNLKRFMAFSSIAQVAFILLGITGGYRMGTPAVVYFILIYAFSNLAAFAVISIVSSASGKETLDDFRGFYKNNKLLSWVFTLALFSLAGIPPTAGFFGKFFLILSGAGDQRAEVWIIALVVLNLVVSLYYYLRVVRAIFMDEPEQPLAAIASSPAAKLGMWICLAGILVTGVWGWVYGYIQTLL